MPDIEVVLRFVVLLHTLFALPLLGLALGKRIYPHFPLAIVMGVVWALSFVVLFWADFSIVIGALDIAILLIAGSDLLTIPRKRLIHAERKTSKIVSLRKDHSVSLLITNTSIRSFRVVVRDDIPPGFTATPSEFVIDLAGRSRSTLTYELSASRRGAFELAFVHLQVRSKLGFWKRIISYPATNTLHVYPDMKQLSEYAILARTNRLSLLGVRRTRKIGQDNDFERLRDYTPDDNYKHIDWRSTARRQKLTVKDYQTSQSQRILFLIDCGRMMTNEAVGLSLLDHALNSMLMLSYVALRQGDSVGAICFSDSIHSYIPPKGGMGQMNQLLHASFDRFPNLVESRYDQAFLYLASNCKKRSLVILISNLIDEVNAHQVDSYLTNITGHHLPVGVLLRDHQLFDAADNPRQAGLYTAAAAAEILTWRHQILTDLHYNGVLCLDVFPEDMTAPLINQYLEIKARHLL